MKSDLDSIFYQNLNPDTDKDSDVVGYDAKRMSRIRIRCNEHGTIYAISSDFGDRMTTQHLD